jgi:hypothetical protein
MSPMAHNSMYVMMLSVLSDFTTKPMASIDNILKILQAIRQPVVEQVSDAALS